MTNNRLNGLLTQNKWFCINSITYGDGKMTLFDMEYYSGKYEIRFIADTTVDSFLFYNPDDFFDFDIFCKTNYKEFEIFAGDGSYESEGYICAMNKEKDRVEWFIFFENSTPFYSLDVNEEGLVTCYTKNKIAFNIPIQNPKEFSLRYPY